LTFKAKAKAENLTFKAKESSIKAKGQGLGNKSKENYLTFKANVKAKNVCVSISQSVIHKFHREISVVVHQRSWSSGWSVPG